MAQTLHVEEVTPNDWDGASASVALHFEELFGVHIAPKRGGGGKRKAGSKGGCVRDGHLFICAHAKGKKKEELSAAKTLGDNPAEQLLEPGRRPGLRNLGATCYMNSLLQCLFMSRSFRHGIYTWQPGDGGGGGGGGGAVVALVQLQRLFAHLQSSHRAIYKPSGFSAALEIDTSVHQDVQEFNKLLLSFLGARPYLGRLARHPTRPLVNASTPHHTHTLPPR